MSAAALRAAMTDLSGRTAIVTGGARGQGEAEVRLLVECGARVLICDVLDEGAALADELGQRFLKLDVTSEAGWAEAAALVWSKKTVYCTYAW